MGSRPFKAGRRWSAKFVCVDVNVGRDGTLHITALLWMRMPHVFGGGPWATANHKCTTEEGDEYLRTLLVRGAHYILGSLGEGSDLRRWGQKPAARGGRTSRN
jgi:hypothetical protein